MQPPLLPQHDPDPVARARALVEARARYIYDHAIVPPLALYHQLPSDELFSLAYLTERLGSAIGVPVNLLAVKLRTLVDRFDHLQDYEDLFTVLARPAIVDSWRSDLAFAEQRLSGCETRMLTRVDHIPDHLRVDADLFRSIAGFSLAEAEADGRLFLCDYGVLDGLPAGGERGASKFVYAPIALFTWQPDHDAAHDAPPSQRGRLIPIAIQLDQRPTRTNLYTPRDGVDWLLARTVVQNADYTVCMMCHHVARVHLGMETFAMATARQLGEHHPVARLLRPHQRYMLVQDELSRRLFVNPGGYIERLYGPTLEGSIDLARRGYADWRVDDWSFPRDLERRGLAGDHLPHYPWRDDGRLLWDAIYEYVGAHLRRAYPEERDLHHDDEIRGWLGELVDPAGANLRGLPGEFSREALHDLLTNIVFTNGPYHSAMNYRQAEYASFVPNYPMALYSPMPAVRGVADESYLLDMLPPQGASLGQLEIVTLLTSYQHDQLGQFEADDRLHEPPDLHDLVVAFQERLVTAEQKIEARNRERAVPYRGLLPSLISNSASV